MKTRLLAVVAALALLGFSQAKANTVFAVHDSYTIVIGFPDGSPLLVGFLDGTITTNGSLGVLHQADIVAWELTIASVFDNATQLLNNGNSNVTLVGNGLTATPTALFYNYDVIGFLEFRLPPFLITPDDVRSAFASFGFLGAAHPIVDCPLDALCAPPLGEARSGTKIIGVGQAPLPAALPLFVTGLGALGLLGWRWKLRQGKRLS